MHVLYRSSCVLTLNFLWLLCYLIWHHDFANYDLALLGDFNLPEIPCVDGPRFCGKDSHFLSVRPQNTLKNIIFQSTCFWNGQASNILDLVILSNPDLCIKNEVTTPVVTYFNYVRTMFAHYQTFFLTANILITN